MVTADRIPPLDESFLRLETDAVHMHVGWTLRFAGEAPALEDLRRQIDGRLDLIPRFRQRVVEAPLGLGDAMWADDPLFDVANHVHAIAVPGAGTPARLQELAGLLLSQRLDRSRPLWRMFLLDGLAGDEFAVVGQAHHALVDGIAAIEVAQLLLDVEQHSPPEPPPMWRPEPAPGLASVMLSAAQERARRGLVAGTLALRALRQPALIGELSAGVRGATAALRTVAAPTEHTTLNRPIGSRRKVAFAELELSDVRSAGKEVECTVNDVVLATMTLALGRYLRRRGDDCERFRAMIPVNLRTPEEAGALGNRISFMFVELPIAERDPARVLELVRAETAARKHGDEAPSLYALLAAAGWLPSPARRAVARLTARPGTFNAVISNMPGPPQPLYLLGKRLEAVYPAVPLAEGHGVSVGVLSYRNKLYVGLYADSATVGDVDDLSTDIVAAFEALCPSAPTPRPTRPRAAPEPVTSGV